MSDKVLPLLAQTINEQIGHIELWCTEGVAHAV